MKLALSHLRIVLVLIVVVVACPMARAGEERKSWQPDEARKYLDERQTTWFAFSSADRGDGRRHATLELRWLRSPSEPRLVITRAGPTQTPMPESCCSATI